MHSFGDPVKEVVTTLHAERWENNGMKGYAFMAGCGEMSHNVSLHLNQFLFAGKALDFLANLQGYQEVPPANSGANGGRAGR